MDETSIKLLSELCKWFGIAQYETVGFSGYEDLVLEVCDYISLDVSDEDMDEVINRLEEENGETISSE